MTYIIKHADGMYLRSLVDVDTARISDFRDVPRRLALRFALKSDAYETVEALEHHCCIGWRVVRLRKTTPKRREDQ